MASKLDNLQVDVIGIDKVINKLKRSSKSINNAMGESMKQIASFEERNVKQSIAGQKQETRSVDTGKFLNSVREEHGRNYAKIYTNVEYAKFLEYGTSKLAPRKHFANTLIRDRPKIIEYLRKKVLESKS